MTSFMTSSEDVIWVNPSISLFSHFENINRRYYHLLFYYHISGGSRISHRGGVDSRGGYVLEFFMSKRKNLDPWGRAPGTPPLDPPMHVTDLNQSKHRIFLVMII